MILTICKICNDMLDPLEDGVYIVVRNDRYRAIVRKDGKHMVDNTYMKSDYTFENVLFDMDVYL